jgi:hypothetical protein
MRLPLEKKTADDLHADSAESRKISIFKDKIDIRVLLKYLDKGLQKF